MSKFREQFRHVGPAAQVFPTLRPGFFAPADLEIADAIARNTCPNDDARRRAVRDWLFAGITLYRANRVMAELRLVAPLRTFLIACGYSGANTLEIFADGKNPKRPPFIHIVVFLVCLREAMIAAEPLSSDAPWRNGLLEETARGVLRDFNEAASWSSHSTQNAQALFNSHKKNSALPRNPKGRRTLRCVRAAEGEMLQKLELDRKKLEFWQRTQTITQRQFGDPPLHRSALWKKLNPDEGN
jgi:hypothetical protein